VSVVLLKNDHNKEAMASLAPNPLGLSAASLFFNARERKSERSARESRGRRGREAREASQTKNRKNTRK